VVDFCGLGAVHLPVQPMNAPLVPEPFDWPGWAPEEKYDGVRILAYKKGSERESGKTCVLGGFLKGSYSAPPAAQTPDSRQNGG
jgi:hypothetical protein